MPTLSLRDWNREVQDRQDDPDHLSLSDLHVDPSPCTGAYNDHNISITILPGRSLTCKGFHHWLGGDCVDCVDSLRKTEYQLNHSRLQQTPDKALVILELLNTGQSGNAVQPGSPLYHLHTHWVGSEIWTGIISGIQEGFFPSHY